MRFFYKKRNYFGERRAANFRSGRQTSTQLEACFDIPERASTLVFTPHGTALVEHRSLAHLRFTSRRKCHNSLTYCQFNSGMGLISFLVNFLAQREFNQACGSGNPLAFVWMSAFSLAIRRRRAHSNGCPFHSGWRGHRPLAPAIYGVTAANNSRVSV